MNKKDTFLKRPTNQFKSVIMNALLISLLLIILLFIISITYVIF